MEWASGNTLYPINTMKLTTATISHMAQSVLRGHKHYGEHFLLHPAREWGIGILGFLFLCGGGAWWAALTYLAYQDTSQISAETPVNQVTTYRAEEVSAALRILDVREKRMETVTAGLKNGAQPAATSTTGSVAVPPPSAPSTTPVTVPEVIPTSTTAATPNASSGEAVPQLSF